MRHFEYHAKSCRDRQRPRIHTFDDLVAGTAELRLRDLQAGCAAILASTHPVVLGKKHAKFKTPMTLLGHIQASPLLDLATDPAASSADKLIVLGQVAKNQPYTKITAAIASMFFGASATSCRIFGRSGRAASIAAFYEMRAPVRTASYTWPPACRTRSAWRVASRIAQRSALAAHAKPRQRLHARVREARARTSAYRDGERLQLYSRQRRLSRATRTSATA